jgi:hypothetical protein
MWPAMLFRKYFLLSQFHHTQIQIRRMTSMSFASSINALQSKGREREGKRERNDAFPSSKTRPFMCYKSSLMRLYFEEIEIFNTTSYFQYVFMSSS